MKISKYGAEHILTEKLVSLAKNDKELLRELLIALFGEYLYNHAVKSFAHMLHQIDSSIIVDEELKIDKSRFNQKYRKLNGTQMRILAKAVKDIEERARKNKENLKKRQKIISSTHMEITEINEEIEPLI